MVAFGFFLPVGLMVWLALWLTHDRTTGQDTSLVLLALSGLGTGYVPARSFPATRGRLFLVVGARWCTTPPE